VNDSFYLITTALKETWNLEKSVLFIGEWCLIYPETCSSLNCQVSKYHWDDRKKLELNYRYLDSVYIKYLSQLSIELNQIHSVEYSKRFWEIIIGPWLKTFIQIVFDRYEQVKYVESNYNINDTIVSKFDTPILVPKNLDVFANYYSNDSWNFEIFSYIIKKHTSFNWTEIELNSYNNFSKRKDSIKSRVKKIGFKLLKILPRNKSFLLIDFPVSIYNKVILYFTKGYFFEYSGESNEISINTAQSKIDFRAFSLKSDSDFEYCLCNLIPKQIPTDYLEGFQNLMQKSEMQFSGKGIKCIVTPYINYNEKLKIHISKQSELGSKLIVLQHGGTYGISKFFSTETHELNVSDIFISWGWKHLNNDKILPLGILNQNKLPKRKSSNQKDNLLLVLGSVPRYSYKLWSECISSQILYYLDNQINFISNLDNHIFRQLIVKPYPVETGWNINKRIIDQFDNLNIAQGHEKLYNLVRKSKIVIATYNSTTFLETLSQNIPTVIFWDPKYWELREDSLYYFERLKEIGVFHENEFSAASHINKVWNDVDSWWLSSKTQQIVNEFVSIYAKQDKGILRSLTSLIESCNN
jgi:putative transferase (TIGR04331 family)